MGGMIQEDVWLFSALLIQPKQARQAHQLHVFFVCVRTLMCPRGVTMGPHPHPVVMLFVVMRLQPKLAKPSTDLTPLE